MKILEIDYTTKLAFTSPVSDHYFLLRCVPVSKNGQTVVSRNLEITPPVQLVTSKDIFGNISYQGWIDYPHEEFSFHSTATVIVDRKNGCRELCHPFYKYNTELTSASSEMKDFLYSIFDRTLLADCVRNKKIKNCDINIFAEELGNAVYKKIEYTPGVTNVRTTASQAFEMKKGVCQDYAHIFCALCREAGIPARYVAGTSMGEGSTHAWVEYFIPDEDFVSFNGKSMEGKWCGIDCTRNKMADDTYVIFASGRDYLDCKVDGGIFRGMASQNMSVFVTTREQEYKKAIINSQQKTKPLDEQIRMLKIKNQQQQM